MVWLENMSSTLTTMQDVIDAVHTYTKEINNTIGSLIGGSTTESLRFLSLQPTGSKPPFALRVLVKERLAAIIAHEIAGGDHSVDLQDDYIVVRIGMWKEITRKWFIPSGSWKTFRAAALESMMLVGERSLIKEGPAAFYRLSPSEFQSTCCNHG